MKYLPLRQIQLIERLCRDIEEYFLPHMYPLCWVLVVRSLIGNSSMERYFIKGNLSTEVKIPQIGNTRIRNIFRLLVVCEWIVLELNLV